MHYIGTLDSPGKSPFTRFEKDVSAHLPPIPCVRCPTDENHPFCSPRINPISAPATVLLGLLTMQTSRSAVALLLITLSAAMPHAALAKPHTVTLGPMRRVPYVPPEANADNKTDEATTLKVRPLLVDGAQKEWTVGETHDVTDRTFVVRRALRINDALPGEPPRWTWQPGPWLSIDRVTAHIAALHLPDFDPQVSEAVWYRDYAAYCGIATTVKGGLVAVVTELGARKAAVQKVIGPWPQEKPQYPACALAKWQKTPMRATIQPTGGAPQTFDVVGTVSLIEEGEATEP